MRRLPAAIFVLIACTAPAEAHSAARGFVLLLPTGYVILGGALAVLLSFAVVAALKRPVLPPGVPFDDPQTRRTHIPSLITAALLLALLWVGFAGPHDPAENLLPLSVWTLWWVVLVLLHPLFGNLWATLNPFSGPAALLQRAIGKSPSPRLPQRLAYWPAFIIFTAFAWFQLVDPAPQDPERLAVVVAIYASATLAMTWLFSPGQWLGGADPFAIFLRQLGAAAPRAGGRWRWPGVGLLDLETLPLAGFLFVLLTLASISFDGFANTFLWLSWVGVNPLDYPGRTALMTANTLGLAASFVVLTFVYVSCICLGWLWAARPVELPLLLGRLVLSLIPISIAYHFAHYLGDTLLNLQYAGLALNDPLGSGANLLGLAQLHVTASFQNTASGALALFTAQTVAIVFGHVIAIAVAHAMTAELGLARGRALKLETPLAAFMIAYTAFGLWLLATPAIG